MHADADADAGMQHPSFPHPCVALSLFCFVIRRVPNGIGLALSVAQIALKLLFPTKAGSLPTT